MTGMSLPVLRTLLRDLSKTPTVRQLIKYIRKANDDNDGKSISMPFDPLARLQEQIEILEKFEPPTLLPLSERMRQIAAPVEGGTVDGNRRQMERLRAAAETRMKEIEDLVSLRDDLEDVAATFETSALALRTLRIELEKALDSRALLAIDALTGKTLTFTVADLLTTIEPAANARATEAKRALKKVRKTIIDAEVDLRNFEEALAIGEWLSQEPAPPIADQTAAPPVMDNIGDIEFSALRDRLLKRGERAASAAERQREKSRMIDEHNARIAGFQNLLGVLAGAWQIYQGSSADEPGADPEKQAIEVNIDVREYRFESPIWKPEDLDPRPDESPEMDRLP